MKNTSKSPFEIRLDLLEMATTIISQQIETKNSEARINADKTNSSLKLSAMPTTEEIVREAEKLNEFVSTGTYKC